MLESLSPCLGLHRRSLQLGGFLHPRRPLFLLDLGCGSGLSNAVLDKEEIHHIGLDISLDMLHLAQKTLQCIPGTKPLASAGAKAEKSGRASCSTHRTQCTSLLLSDLGQGVPFRQPPPATTAGTQEAATSSADEHLNDDSQVKAAEGMFDGAVSISAVQWLNFQKDPWKATTTFFSTLHK